MVRSALISILCVLIAGLSTGCGDSSETSLTVYSGRGQSLVDPIIQRFQEQTDIPVDVRYGDTAQLAVALIEEGDRSPADLFLAQDGGALGAVQKEGLFMTLPDQVTNGVSEGYLGTDNSWVATSGRARTLAYSPERVDTENLPESVFDLSNDRYEGRVGWAPTNGSFQAFVTAMRHIEGDERTRAWLGSMKENGTKAFGNNRGIIEGIAAGDIDLGIPNHYYLYRYKADDAEYPVEQTFFATGDVGNLVNVAGIGILASSAHREAAEQFVSYLLASEAQTYFANETYEYPVSEGTSPTTEIADMDRIDELRPDIRLDELSDLEGTLDMLRDVGLL